MRALAQARRSHNTLTLKLVKGQICGSVWLWAACRVLRAVVGCGPLVAGPALPASLGPPPPPGHIRSGTPEPTMSQLFELSPSGVEAVYQKFRCVAAWHVCRPPLTATACRFQKGEGGGGVALTVCPVPSPLHPSAPLLAQSYPQQLFSYAGLACRWQRSRGLGRAAGHPLQPNPVHAGCWGQGSRVSPAPPRVAAPAARTLFMRFVCGCYCVDVWEAGGGWG
jgi:hypothetical protein